MLEDPREGWRVRVAWYLPWTNRRQVRALLLALAASCGTHQLVTSERLGRGALTPHTQGPEMQIKAGQSHTPTQARPWPPHWWNGAIGSAMSYAQCPPSTLYCASLPESLINNLQSSVSVKKSVKLPMESER